MGCQTEVEIGANLTFTVASRNQSTGALVDADSAPAYRLYEDEIGTPILTGNMALLDDAGTLGFYSEQIAATTANGFESGKSYSIYITIVVAGLTYAVTYGFRALTVTSASGTAAISTTAKAAPDGFVITTGLSELNDEDSTHAEDGTAVNSRTDVSIVTPASSVDVVLSGDDTAAITGANDTRIFTLKAVYTSTEGAGLPLNDEAKFFIAPLVSVS